MNTYQVIAASKNNFIFWHYKTPKSVTGRLSLVNKIILIAYITFSVGFARYKMFHIDDNPSGAVEIIQDLDNTTNLPVAHTTLWIRFVASLLVKNAW